ncbi:MAG: arylsulfatase A-like enzyme [Myxococcota bacterium]
MRPVLASLSMIALKPSAVSRSSSFRELTPRTSGWVAIRLLAGLACAPLCACQPGTTADRPSARPSPVEEGASLNLALARPVELELPSDSREGQRPPIAIPVSGPFQFIGTTKKGMRKFEAQLPLRPRGLFFHRAEPGMRLERAGHVVKYTRFGAHDGPTWTHDRDTLTIHLPLGAEPPTNGEYVLSYRRATDRELALNLVWSPHAADPEAFLRTTVQDGWDARQGLLLPAPGHVAFEVEVPDGGELVFDSGIVSPESLDGAPSDGAELTITVEAGGVGRDVARLSVAPGVFAPHRVDLSAWAGQTVRLRLSSAPGESTRFDYVFIADPILSSRLRNPRRVVMVFLDTTRPDHMSLYGYARDTTAKLDGLVESAAVFSNARTVSPWTLPSARTVMTGRQPDYYNVSPTLPQLLRDDGWATAMIGGNVYLSPNFGMARGWGLHRVSLWPLASTVVDDAIEWLDAHDAQDAFIQVQFMEAHLPYSEPAAYRKLYAAEGPEFLRDEFHLSDVRRVDMTDPDAQQYVKDRYDNNIRYMTDQVARLLPYLDDEDVLVIYGDHGEEFWEHGGFEHGHSLYDELLKVPLVIDGPGIDGGRLAAPVSLLDIAPTVLELAGLDSHGLDGTSLVAAAQGDPDARQALRQRDLAFGRTLYGMERWGVLAGDRKWTSAEGRETLYDLGADPGETRNLVRKADTTGYFGVLADALGRDVAVAYRLVNLESGKPSRDVTRAVLHIPGGIETAFVGEDPLENSSALVAVDDDAETVTVTWPAGQATSREVYIVPSAAPEEVTHLLELTVDNTRLTRELTVPEGREPGLGDNRRPLAVARLGERSVQLTFAITPLPDDDAQILRGTDDELGQALEAMGYVEN